MPAETILHGTINDQPYTIRKNEHGWSVGAASALTDRFHRTYQIFTSAEGTPLKCSCPDCVYRLNWCKHLRAVEAILKNESTPTA